MKSSNTKRTTLFEVLMAKPASDSPAPSASMDKILQTERPAKTVDPVKLPSAFYTLVCTW